jgi:RNase P/RNase MRP subunit p29
MNYPIGSTVVTTVHGIGGRSERVSGEVVDYKRNALVVKTDYHGRIVVPVDQIKE